MAAPLTVSLLRRWADACAAALGAARAEIDALNVYPVPDSDTGTNLYLTVEAAAAVLRVRARRGDTSDTSDPGGTRDPGGTSDPGDTSDAVALAVADFSRAALLGARGNSGVIMAQLMRAGLGALVHPGPDAGVLLPDVVSHAFREAADAAWTAVGAPVEGTILSVARAAADGAAVACQRVDGDGAATVADVVTAAAIAARAALARTPEQLDLLRRAGVVDAGGRGLVVVLDATARTVTGRWEAAPPTGLGARTIPTPIPVQDLTADGPAYEVMYLLDAEDGCVPALRDRLCGLGDSLVVIGGEGLWNVHVHVDDVGAAVEAGIEAGRPHRIAVTHFAEQTGLAGSARSARSGHSGHSGRSVVLMAAGPGMAALFESAGGKVVRGTPGVHCSSEDFLAAIESTGAAEVIVLPNDGATVPAAEAAASQARAHGVRVAVVPTRAQVQGLAAIAVHEPGRGFDDDVVAMTSAASHTRHGAVTVATQQAMTMAGPCEPGDVLGVLDGDFAIVGHDAYRVAAQVVDRLLSGGGEMVTLVTGAQAADDLADRLEAAIRESRPELDTVVYSGGQQRYPLLVAVE